MEALQILAQNTYQYQDSSGSAAGGLFVMLFYVAVIVVAIVGVWKVFQKAGQPGWAAIVPIYNTYIMTKIAGRPGWWVLLYFIPIVNIIISAIVSVDIAKSFGRSELFGVFGLWLFSFVGYLILGFGDDTYKGPRPTASAA